MRAIECTGYDECKQICSIQFFGQKDFYNEAKHQCEEMVSCSGEYTLDEKINQCVDSLGNVFK